VSAEPEPEPQGEGTARGVISIVLVSHPSRGAEAFAERIVTTRLAACVSLLPAISVFNWEGALERTEERLLVIKTQERRLDELETFVRSEHPYSLPEFVVLPACSSSNRYHDWIIAQSTPEPA